MSSLTACPAGAERDRLIADIAAGRILATTAWQPATGATSTASTPVEAYRHDNHYHLSGDCYFVAVPQAEFILAAAKLDGVTELFAIRRGPGTALGLNWLADGSQAAKVHFETDIPLAARLSAGVDMSSALDDAVDAATLSTSAEILGVMERSLTLTRDYISTRRQFGRAIGTFQTLQHQLVDMWIQVQLTRAALTGALSRFRASDTTRPDRASAASSAKARASQAALFVAERAIQLHGAIGMTDEYELGVYVNRALVLASQFGNATAHRRRYSELVALEERQL
jgi:alkylation response protein AidB-like acyl-CoA dehydrogenase